MTPHCALSLHDFPSTTFPEWQFLTFIIFQGTGLSNSCFESAFLLFPFMFPLSQHLYWADESNVGTTANCISLLTLSLSLCNLYIKVVETFIPDSPVPCLH